jgi:DNA-binding transcriptional MerR regulator
MSTTYKLDELAEAAGVSPRTVRYYVQRGLLPAPPFRGRDTVYGAEHLERLQTIRRLQEQYLPLDAIQAELEGRGAPAPKLPAPVPAPARVSAPSPARWLRVPVGDGLELLVEERRYDPALVDAIRKVVGFEN